MGLPGHMTMTLKEIYRGMNMIHIQYTMEEVSTHLMIGMTVRHGKTDHIWLQTFGAITAGKIIMCHVYAAMVAMSGVSLVITWATKKNFAQSITRGTARKSVPVIIYRIYTK